MVKIKSINISGLRGIKEPLTFDLNANSVLVYGDNGAGKSSLTDAFEWFFYDHIEHLSNEEIGRRKGRDALRNLFISDNEYGFMEIKFNNSKLDAKKTIDSSLNISVSNDSSEFNDFIAVAQSENLILRYRDLVQFIIASKSDKLTELQKIIGYSEVADLRKLLKTNAVRIARNIKSANYDNQKNVQQSKILENLGQNVQADQHLFDGANELIKPLNLSIEIRSHENINQILKKIESKEDSALLEQINFFTRLWEALSEVVGNVDNINDSYKVCHFIFEGLQKDPEKIKKLQLLALLKEGRSALKKDVVQDDYCPLCQQKKSKIQLIQELNKRIDELEQLAEEKNKLDAQGEELKQLVQSNINIIDGLLKDKLFKKEEHEEWKQQVEGIKGSLNVFLVELKKDLSTTYTKPNEIEIDKNELSSLVKQAQETAKKYKASQSANIKFQVYTKLFHAVTAYSEYQRIEKEQSILTKQQVTFEILHADFIKRQEEALNVFLVKFSQDIDDYYKTMNPKEKVGDIRIVSIKKDGDLVGITIEYSFFDETKTPPIAYLSESHINCLGLSFFLASVKAFNNEDKFFVLDDIISSFDRSHRARFAKLLTDKFSDYQIILLTHEKEFFELVVSEVKSQGWVITRFKWTEENGVGMGKGPDDIKERILRKFEDRNTDGLGNDIRVYTEKVMKEIAFNIEAPVAFRYNELNEKRMASELLDAIQSQLSKKGKDLKKKADIVKLKGMPMFIANTSSHDNEFNESIEDLEVMWEDIKKTIDIFYCNDKDCMQFISTKYFDNVNNKIRCRCGKLAYDWKK